MIEILLVKTPSCAVCEKVRKTLEAEVAPLFPDIEINEIDATTPQGQDLVIKYGIVSSPGVILNGELFSMGGINKERLIERLKEISNKE
jgi:alkyl hydroperoxide reductase subunit AhpF